jgi:hypothetical protein
MFAPAVRRATGAEGNVRRVVPSDDALGIISEELGAKRKRISVVIDQGIRLELNALSFKSIRRIKPCPAGWWRWWLRHAMLPHTVRGVEEESRGFVIYHGCGRNSFNQRPPEKRVRVSG